MTTPAPPRRKGRINIGCLPFLVLMVVVGCAFVMATDFVFAPWIYTVGGRSRLMPVWQGEGVAQGPGGAYHFYIWFSPTSNKQHVVVSTSIEGGGYLCTPRGKKLNLFVGGGAPGRVWRNMDGHTFGLYVRHRAKALDRFNGALSWPSFSLSGRWDGPDLALQDDGGLKRSFNPDGSVRPRPGDWSHPQQAALRLVETGWGAAFAPCPG